MLVVTIEYALFLFKIICALVIAEFVLVRVLLHIYKYYYYKKQGI